VAERVRAAIAEHPDGLPDGASLSASVGIAICPPERSSMRPEDLFAVADAALYRSKREGKNRVNVDAL
jgi:GGDEF domain-containing protein